MGMSMPRAAEAARAERKATLRPLFAQLDREGRRRTWLAERLEIPKTRLWMYEHGEARIPMSLIERISNVLGVAVEDVFPGGVPSDLIQQRPPRAPYRRRATKARDSPHHAA
jgi:hypothetical protein